MAARRASEIVAAIARGKMDPREMPPHREMDPTAEPLRDFNLTRGQKTVPPKTSAALMTSIGGPGSSTADAVSGLQGPSSVTPAPHLTTATTLSQNTVAAPLQAKVVVPLVPRKPSAGGRGGSHGSAMMAAMMGRGTTRHNNQVDDSALPIREPHHSVTLTGGQELASTGSLEPPGDSVHPQSPTGPRPTGNAIGSVLGGLGARKNGGSGGSMAGILGGGRKVDNSCSSQMARHVAGGSSAERVERLRASFTLPFVSVPDSALRGGGIDDDHPAGSAAESARSMERSRGAVGSDNKERAGEEAGTQSQG